MQAIHVLKKKKQKKKQRNSWKLPPNVVHFAFQVSYLNGTARIHALYVKYNWFFMYDLQNKFLFSDRKDPSRTSQ
jgi:hypothetical protein